MKKICQQIAILVSWEEIINIVFYRKKEKIKVVQQWNKRKEIILLLQNERQKRKQLIQSLLKKRAIIENISGKRGNELPDESDNKKSKVDTTFGPFSPAYKLKRILLLFFQRTPARIPEFLPFSNSYDQIKPFIQNLDEETTQKLYDRVITKYPRKSLPNETNGGSINKPLLSISEIIDKTDLTDFEKLLYALKFMLNYVVVI